MSDSFQTSRGTAITKLSEEYRASFKISELPTMNGTFVKHLLGMYRFLGQTDKIKLHEINSKIQTAIDGANQKRDAAIKAVNDAFIIDVEVMLDETLPNKEGDPRSPVIHDVTIQEVELQYTISEYEEKPVDAVETQNGAING